MTRQIDEVMQVGPDESSALQRLRAEIAAEYPGWTLDTVKIERNGARHGLPIRQGFEWAAWGQISRPLDETPPSAEKLKQALLVAIEAAIADTDEGNDADA